MKKLPLILMAALLVLGLYGCGSSGSAAMPTATPKPTKTGSPIKQTFPLVTPTKKVTPTPTPTPDPLASWDTVSELYPLLTYDEIKTGKYDEQNVIVEAFVETVEYDGAFDVDLTVWYESEEYAFVRETHRFDWEDIHTKEIEILPGDTLQLCVWVYKGSSFGSPIQAVHKTSSDASVGDFIQGFKDCCQSPEYKAVLRNPEEYRGSNFTFTGDVVQVVSEESYCIKFLLETYYGELIYVWYFPENSSRILEGDNVAIYGTFHVLETYDTLFGENTVPRLSAYFLELNE